MSDTVTMLPLDSIVPDEVQLRGVNKDDEQFQSLVASVKDKGVLSSIIVRPHPGEDGVYILVNGNQRTEAAREAGLTQIPAIVRETQPNGEPWDEMSIYTAQIEANAQAITTRPAQYADQLVRIMSINPSLTQSDIASRVNMSPSWVSQMLKLSGLTDDIKVLVDNGDICVSNAVALAKLPAESQEEWIERAQTESPDEFIPAANARASEIRKRPKGMGGNEFQVVPKLRTRAVVEDHYSEHAEALSDADDESVNRENFDYRFGYAEGIAWCLSLDPETVQEKRDEHEARIQERLAKKMEKEREKQTASAAAEGIGTLLGNKDTARPVGLTG